MKFALPSAQELRGFEGVARVPPDEFECRRICVAAERDFPQENSRPGFKRAVRILISCGSCVAGNEPQDNDKGDGNADQVQEAGTHRATLFPLAPL
jgi:hypothetical protein